MLWLRRFWFWLGGVECPPGPLLRIDSAEYDCEGNLLAIAFGSALLIPNVSLFIQIEGVWTDTGESWGISLCESNPITANLSGYIAGNGDYPIKLITVDGSVESEVVTLSVECEPEFMLKFEDSGSQHVTFAMDGDFEVDWGDGTVESDDGTAAHTYVDGGPYYVKVTGTPDNIYEIGESGGKIVSLKNLPISVKYVDVALPVSTAVTIDISNLTALEAFSLGNADSSLVPTISLPASNNISSFTAYNGYFDSAFVNEVLANLVANGVENGYLTINAQTPSAPPTGQGLIDKAELISRGWTVNTD